MFVLRLTAHDCTRMDVNARGENTRSRFSYWLEATTTNERSERVYLLSRRAAARSRVRSRAMTLCREPTLASTAHHFEII